MEYVCVYYSILKAVISPKSVTENLLIISTLSSVYQRYNALQRNSHTPPKSGSKSSKPRHLTNLNFPFRNVKGVISVIFKMRPLTSFLDEAVPVSAVRHCRFLNECRYVSRHLGLNF